jgi:hypothetical protein
MSRVPRRAFLSLLAAPGAWAQGGLWLVTAREAGLPAGDAQATRAITRGPALRYVTPRLEPVAAGAPFWFRVEFRARGGSQMDPAATRVELLRGGTIDITPRVAEFLTPGALDVPSALAAPGRHALRVTVADDQGRRSVAVIEIDVR